MSRRVAITGLGAVTPVGNDVPSTWEALCAGRSGISGITAFDATTYPVRIAGEVKRFNPESYVPEPQLRRHLSRAGGFGVAATVQALTDAGVKAKDYEPHEKGVAMGGTMGRPDFQLLVDISHARAASDNHALIRQGPRDVLIRDQNLPMTVMARLADCRGPMISISTACTASAHALGEAFRSIQEGDARLMIAGGYDSLISYLDVLGFGLLGALAAGFEDKPQKASRPFERDRVGFVLGEGAVVAVLEDLESARTRGARVYAEIVGYGSSMNAYRMTDAPPDGGGTVVAVGAALEESGLGTGAVDYVAAHGTSTPGNDLCETMALKRVFGQNAQRLAVSSVKSMTGHLTAAAGGLNLLSAVLSIRDQVVPPTINYENPDPKLDLDYVPNRARKMRVRAAMLNAFAFGGTNASLVVREPEGAGAGRAS
jgi:3-oxoacyl-[acyl-carrier-protein] synthase II